MNYNMINIPCFGVAGNFTGHLEQAGEAVDFLKIKAEAGAPKAVFPTYIPKNDEGITPEFLHVYPFDVEKIIFPKNETKLQIEPECALIFNALWNENELIDLQPLVFGASNDCSIRKEGAKKISEKKNWGKSSKGFSANLIPVKDFTNQGELKNYRIASFLIRNNEIFEYGEDSSVSSYSYIYETLKKWLLEKFNNQNDEGPAENIHQYLLEAGKPSQIMVSIGATRYTDFGEHNFLEKDDLSLVAVYPENKYTHEELLQLIKNNDFSAKDISFLCQKIIKE